MTHLKYLLAMFAPCEGLGFAPREGRHHGNHKGSHRNPDAYAPNQHWEHHLSNELAGGGPL